MTGLGRTGKLFAIEHYNIVPDIIVMGRALGVYCPLAAVVLSSKGVGVFDDNVFGHAQSLSGCAAILAGINVSNEEKILDRVREMGQYLGNRLKTLEQTHKSVGEVRGIGLFWTLELVRNRETKEPFTKQMDNYVRNVLTEISEYLLREKNIYIPADKFGIWIVPPLIVEKQEIDFIVDSIDEALEIADNEVTE